ncbi:MAG: hypothetical protein KDA89_12305, partial [Planctomycetaceae bacterium]|nr:hypothetical protein [Planctomycetaceae bacterium]
GSSEPDERKDGTFRVMVRTQRYFSEGEVPHEPRNVSSVTGMLRRTLTARNIDRGRLLLQQFPGVDPDSVLLLEDRQQPMGFSIKLGLVVAGLVLLLLAWTARRARQTPPVLPESFAPTEDSRFHP